mgnify:CR=1 FL=1
MICALLIGREGSSGFPGKNLYPVLGRPMAYYPIKIALSCKNLSRVYVSTDSKKLSDLAYNCGAEIIHRPSHLASSDALGEDAFVHGYNEIVAKLADEGETLELLVLLFANAVTFTSTKIDEGIRILRHNLDYDSATTVSCYNMWSPIRARKINESGLLEPFVPLDVYGDPKQINCDRDSQGDVWYADMGFTVVRPRCLDNIENGQKPQQWMGSRIYPLKQWGGLDVDEPWQIPIIESWLEAHEINNVFHFKRIRWNQLYDSERKVLTKVRFNNHDKVLDIGHEPGALSLILAEKFNITNCTAITSDYDNIQEVYIVNPNAKIIHSNVHEYLNNQSIAVEYNAIFGLHINDEQDYFKDLLNNAFKILRPGGYLIGTCRLTNGDTINDKNISYQRITGVRDTIVPYIINNANEVLESLRKTDAKEIILYGYSGRPSSTATTPLKIVTFAVFAVRKKITIGDDKFEDIELPESILL